MSERVAENGRSPCPYDPGSGRVEFRPDRFRDLAPNGRTLIIGWAGRATETLTRATSPDPDGQTPWQRSRYTFESFIYAWISFNGWASCCCESDTDRALINALRSDERVSTEFDALLQSDSAFAQAVAGFRELWPIFRASQVREGKDIAALEYGRGGRQALVEYYIYAFADKERAPNCHLRHQPGQIPADWAHTLEALYRVRNNLFHGTKSSDGNVDRQIVDAATAVLVPVVSHLLSADFR